MSALRILAKEQYIKRHDKVRDKQHFNIRKERGVKLYNEQWHENVPTLTETSHDVRVSTL
jgi:hypothetical protein